MLKNDSLKLTVLPKVQPDLKLLSIVQKEGEDVFQFGERVKTSIEAYLPLVESTALKGLMIDCFTDGLASSELKKEAIQYIKKCELTHKELELDHLINKIGTKYEACMLVDGTVPGTIQGAVNESIRSSPNSVHNNNYQQRNTAQYQNNNNYNNQQRYNPNRAGPYRT
jgi:hypothetical protein